jgi:hypothetical protein
MTYQTIASIEADIAKRKKELAEMQTALEKAKQESPEIQLARQLHGMLCTWNHTDGCGWFYEMKNSQDDWTGHAHDQYLTKARVLTNRCKEHNLTADQAIAIYKLVKGV